MFIVLFKGGWQIKERRDGQEEDKNTLRSKLKVNSAFLKEI